MPSIESHAVETGDSTKPFVARITFGTRNRKETWYEWPAPSLAVAQQQADDWQEEYAARLGLGDDRIRDPRVMRGRWARLKKAAWLPDLPEPCDKYCRALGETAAPEAETVSRALSIPKARERRRYATDAKIRGVVSSARLAGIDVAGIRAWPDGSVAAFDQRLAFATWPPKEPEPAVNTEDWFGPI